MQHTKVQGDPPSPLPSMPSLFHLNSHHLSGLPGAAPSDFSISNRAPVSPTSSHPSFHRRDKGPQSSFEDSSPPRGETHVSPHSHFCCRIFLYTTWSFVTVIDLIKGRMTYSSAERGWAGLLQTERSWGRRKAESPAGYRGSRMCRRRGKSQEPPDST